MSMQPAGLETTAEPATLASPLRGGLPRPGNEHARQGDPCFVVSRQPNRDYTVDGCNDELIRSIARPRISPPILVRNAFPASVARALIGKLRQCEASHLPVQFSVPVRRDGKNTLWRFSLAPVTSAQGAIQLLGWAQEARPERTPDDETAIDRAVLERLAATSHDILYIFHLGARRLAYVNARVRAVLGYDVQELPAGDRSPFRSFIHPADVTVADEHYRNVAELRDGEVRSVEYRVRRADGHYAWLRCSDAALARDASGRVTGIVGSAIDVTDNRHLLEDLKRTSNRLLETQNEERRRIARELHDCTARQLVALSVGLARLDQLVGRDSGDQPEAAEITRNLRSITRDAQQEIRALSYLLHPPVLESMGIEDALRRFLAGFTRRTKIRTSLHVAAGFSCGSHSISSTLMRIAQEALLNVFRHARATEVRVSLLNPNRQTVLEVEDNGKGTSAYATALDERVESMGVGIPGMRARVRQFRGDLQIAGNQNGTILRASIPDRAASMLDSAR